MSRRLTKLQIEHATRRIKEASRARITKEITALGDAPDSPNKEYSKEERYDLIQKGKATLLPFDKCSNYCYLYDAYSYPPRYSKPVALKMERAVEAYEQDCAKIKDYIEAEQGALIDRLILGDSDEAFAMIQAWEKKAK